MMSSACMRQSRERREERRRERREERSEESERGPSSTMLLTSTCWAVRVDSLADLVQFEAEEQPEQEGSEGDDADVQSLLSTFRITLDEEMLKQAQLLNPEP